MERLVLDPQRRSAILQGFGNVRSVAAMTLAQRGTKIIASATTRLVISIPRASTCKPSAATFEKHSFLMGFSTELAFDPKQLLVQPCDVLVPAAVERVIDADVAAALKCRILAEGANGPTTPEADAVLQKRRDEIFVIPDILCNAGGVIVSYFEWVQDLQRLFWQEDEVNRQLNLILDKAFNQVMERATRDGIPHRTAAMSIGVEKVRDGKRRRGLFP